MRRGLRDVELEIRERERCFDDFQEKRIEKSFDGCSDMKQWWNGNGCA